MRVMVISNLYPPDVRGGYELACSQMVDALRTRGHSVEVLTSRSCIDTTGGSTIHRRFHLTDEFSLHGPGNDPLVFRTREAESRLIQSYNVQILLGALREFDPDVVYLHNPVGLGGLGLLAALDRVGTPWLWHLGDSVPRDLFSTSDGVIPGLAARFRGILQGRFVAVSHRTLQECGVVGISKGPSVTLLPYWFTGSRTSSSRRPYRGGPLRVVVAGRVDAQKGSDRLIESVAQLRELGIEDVTVDFYGRIGCTSLVALIRAMGLERHVRLLGPLPHEELVERYADYDVFAFPTQEREPFGIGPIEAMARGCVPLLSAQCGVAEWLVHGVHCLKAPRTATGFAESLAAIRQGRVNLPRLSQRAERAAWDDFHINSIVPKVEHCLQVAMRERRSRSADDGTILRMARLGELLTRSFVEDAVAG
ncbi:MAG: glycosyltransferase family 4 protein [Isosphaeraceae bacterium]